MSPNPNIDRKRMFARLWKYDLVNNPDQNPIKAALGTYHEPEYANFAVTVIAATWPTDTEVLGFVNDMADDEALNDIGATATDISRALVNMIMDTNLDPDYRIKATDRLSEIQGWKQKASENKGGGANAERPKALIIHSAGSDDEWERKVGQQQQDLANS